MQSKSDDHDNVFDMWWCREKVPSPSTHKGAIHLKAFVQEALKWVGVQLNSLCVHLHVFLQQTLKWAGAQFLIHLKSFSAIGVQMGWGSFAQFWHTCNGFSAMGVQLGWGSFGQFSYTFQGLFRSAKQARAMSTTLFATCVQYLGVSRKLKSSRHPPKQSKPAR